jgi:hypothetical protein
MSFNFDHAETPNFLDLPVWESFLEKNLANLIHWMLSSKKNNGCLERRRIYDKP